MKWKLNNRSIQLARLNNGMWQRSGVAGYVYIQSVYDGNVITTGDASQQHLIVFPKKDNLDMTQVWILRQPDNGTFLLCTNPNFVIMSTKTGYVMDVRGASKEQGAIVQIYKCIDHNNQQFVFHQWMRFWSWNYIAFQNYREIVRLLSHTFVRIL